MGSVWTEGHKRREVGVGWTGLGGIFDRRSGEEKEEEVGRDLNKRAQRTRSRGWMVGVGWILTGGQKRKEDGVRFVLNHRSAGHGRR